MPLIRKRLVADVSIELLETLDALDKRLAPFGYEYNEIVEQLMYHGSKVVLATAAALEEKAAHVKRVTRSISEAA